jgi:hypothetical protein
LYQKIIFNLQHHHHNSSQQSSQQPHNNHYHNQQSQQQKQQQKQNRINLNQLQLDKLNREKCELIASLNYLKQKIQEIEMRQNEAIREVCCYTYSILFFLL